MALEVAAIVGTYVRFCFVWDGSVDVKEMILDDSLLYLSSGQRITHSLILSSISPPSVDRSSNGTSLQSVELSGQSLLSGKTDKSSLGFRERDGHSLYIPSSYQ